MAKERWEEEAKDRFLEFLKLRTGRDWVVLDKDVVVDPGTRRNFDYQLGSDGELLALEIFRLVEDATDLARQRVWSQIVHSLEEELPKRGLKGYVIQTPAHFDVGKAKRQEFIREVSDRLEKAIRANSDVDEFEVEGFSLKRVPEFEAVGFFGVGRGGAVNPPGIALAALLEKLPTKNQQLEAKDHQRDVLIVNWASFVVGTEELIEACTHIDFNAFPNIDELYFEPRQGNIELIFHRALFNSFEASDGPPSAELEPLYLRWLGYRLARKEPRAFDIVKKLTGERGGALWLPTHTREDVVRYGDDFAKKEDWDNALWIIRQFEHDPDPAVQNTPDDPGGEFNLHARIQRGDDIRIITAVRGHLCWALQQVIVRGPKELYPEMFRIVESYATGENLYLRQQATVPLVELVRRRRALQPTGGEFMTLDLAQRIRELAFRMLRENAAFPAVLERVGHVFVYLRDLNEAEAREVLTTLLAGPTDQGAEHAALLMVYFAVFREKHFPEQGAFKKAEFGTLLQEQIAGGVSRVRSHVAWHLWKIVEAGEAELEEVLPYVTALPDGPYDRSAFHHFYRIVTKCTKKNAHLIGPALKKAFEREREFVHANAGEVIWNSEDTWNCLRQLREAGEVACYLDCVDELLHYRHRVYGFPADETQEELTKIDETDPAQAPRAAALVARLLGQG